MRTTKVDLAVVAVVDMDMHSDWFGDEMEPMKMVCCVEDCCVEDCCGVWCSQWRYCPHQRSRSSPHFLP